MTKEKQIIAIAELDGWKYIEAGKDSFGVPYEPCVNREHETILVSRLPSYLTSRDAIIPVIEKLWKNDTCLSGDFILSLMTARDEKTISRIETLLATPSQLVEALLRATNKWEE